MSKRIKPKRRTVNCRKIYQSFYGSIPIDDAGRSYEIHHIDGNHCNNDISNLKAVTIQEHYDIHYAQGDFAACQLITARMELTPEEISIQASTLAKKRVQDGTNPFLNPEIARANNKVRLENGTHPFLNGKMSEEVQRSRLENNTHNLQGERNPNAKRIAAGTHNLLGGELHCKLVQEGRHNMLGGQVQRDRIAKGAHNFVGPDNNLSRIRKGTHQTQIKITCPYCGVSGSVPPMKRWHFDKCHLKS